MKKLIFVGLNLMVFFHCGDVLFADNDALEIICSSIALQSGTSNYFNVSYQIKNISKDKQCFDSSICSAYPNWNSDHLTVWIQKPSCIRNIGAQFICLMPAESYSGNIDVFVFPNQISLFFRDIKFRIGIKILTNKEKMLLEEGKIRSPMDVSFWKKWMRKNCWSNVVTIPLAKNKK